MERNLVGTTLPVISQVPGEMRKVVAKTPERHSVISKTLYQLLEASGETNLIIYRRLLHLFITTVVNLSTSSRTSCQP